MVRASGGPADGTLHPVVPDMTVGAFTSVAGGIYELVACEAGRLLVFVPNDSGE
jgi:hypothetical protein